MYGHLDRLASAMTEPMKEPNTGAGAAAAEAADKWLAATRGCGKENGSRSDGSGKKGGLEEGRCVEMV